MKEIVIFGTGWLGLPLAIKFEKADSEVWVSPRPKTIDLPSKIYPIHFRFKPNLESFPQFMFEKPIQIWTIPPRLNNLDLKEYLGYLDFWISKIPRDKNIKIVFTSSTSIYCENIGEAREDAALCNSSSMFAAEEIIKKSGINYLILRLGGLMGEDRYPAKYFSRKIIKLADSNINYIHQKDAVDFIFEAVKQDLKGIYNLVAPIHPTKREMAIQDCEKRNLPKPIQLIGGTNNKIINSEKIMKDLNLEFSFPNPLDFPIH